ncbi:unnamed protein product [Caenorhabditis brenneri]
MFIKLSVERKEENEALVEYLAEKCEEAKEPLNIKHDALTKFLQRYKEKVREITDEGKRVRQLFCLGVKVDEELMKELEKNAHVTLDGNRKIVKYESHDGSLTLNGDHSHSSKMKNFAAQKRRSQMAMMDNGGEEQEEEEPPAPKRSRNAGPRGNSRRTSENRSAPRTALQALQVLVSQGTRPALNSTGALSDTRQANENLAPELAPIKEEDPEEQNTLEPNDVNIAPGQAPIDPIKEENPEQQNVFEPNDVKPELHHYPEQQPQRNGILSLAAQENFIHYMLALIAMEKLPIDRNVILKLEEAKRNIKMMGAPVIQIDDFEAEILHTVSVARRSSSDFCVEESRSLRDFLLHLRFSVFNLMMVELEELDSKLKEFIEDPNNLNKRIPINKIDKVMNSILDLLVPN